MKIIRAIDAIVDRLLLLGLTLVFLVGLYCLCDTVYVFRHAAAVRGEKAAASGRSYTEDYVARIRIDGTRIDYPVMQGEDNREYLNTDPYGSYSLSGSIFLDSRNSADFSDSYCLLYGHHMDAELMFGALDRFYDRRYFDEHRGGTLRAGEKLFRLESFAVLQIDAAADGIFEPQESETVIRLARERASIFTEPDNTHILALSTCADGEGSARTVVLLSMTEEGTEG